MRQGSRWRSFVLSRVERAMRGPVGCPPAELLPGLSGAAQGMRSGDTGKVTETDRWPTEATMTIEMGKADLHIHTDEGDGVDSLQAILDHAQTETDLDVIAITEHDCLEVGLRARDL